MSGKTLTLWPAVFLLVVALGSSCFGADQAAVFDLTQRLSEQFNERLLSVIKKPEIKFTPYSPNKFALCGGCRSNTMPMLFFDLASCGLNTPKFQRLESTSFITKAFSECSSLKILILETSVQMAPESAAVSMGDILGDQLILAKTETSEGYALRIMHGLLIGALEPDDYFAYSIGSGNSADEEVKLYKDERAFIPDLFVEFKGKHWLRIEIDTFHQFAVIQNENEWGSFSFDKLSSEALLAYAKNICDLETANSN